MMLSHDLSKSPGRYRTSAIYVHDDATDTNVYEGPAAGLVPGLMAELVTGLRAASAVDPLIRAAMAHLNLVMIHPFRDGNGRMARALQTLVLSRGGIAEPAFSASRSGSGTTQTGITGRSRSPVVVRGNPIRTLRSGSSSTCGHTTSRPRPSTVASPKPTTSGRHST